MQTSFVTLALAVEHPPPFLCLCTNGLHNRPHLVRHVSAPPHKLTSCTTAPQSPIYHATLSLLLPSAPLPLPPHERAMDLQKVVLGAVAGKGAGYFSKRLFVKTHLTKYCALRIGYPGAGSNARLVQDPQTYLHKFWPCIRARGARPGFFRIHKHTSTSFGRVSGRGEQCQIISGYTIIPPDLLVHTKPTFKSPPVGHAYDCGPPRERASAGAYPPCCPPPAPSWSPGSTWA